MLLLIAFIVNILLVRFSKYTKLRALFTTGHVQVQQASTAFWLILFACPFLTNNTAILIVMALILGGYWAVGSNLTIKPTPVSYTHLDVYKRQIPGSARGPLHSIKDGHLPEMFYIPVNGRLSILEIIMVSVAIRGI